MTTPIEQELPDTSFVPPVDQEDQRRLTVVREALVQCRRALGLTQPDIAKRLQTPLQRVRNFEAGHNDKVNVTTLQRYARAVGARITFGLEPLKNDDSTVEPS